MSASSQAGSIAALRAESWLASLKRGLMQQIFRLVFHGIPLVPIFFGRTYLTIACLLTIALWYVKTMKLSEQSNELERKGLNNSKEYQELKKIRHRWAYLTYISF